MSTRLPTWKMFRLNVRLRLPSGKVIDVPMRRKARSHEEAIRKVREKAESLPYEIISVTVAGTE